MGTGALSWWQENDALINGAMRGNYMKINCCRGGVILFEALIVKTPLYKAFM